MKFETECGRCELKLGITFPDNQYVCGQPTHHKIQWMDQPSIFICKTHLRKVVRSRERVQYSNGGNKT